MKTNLQKGRQDFVLCALLGPYLVGDVDPLKVLNREMQGQFCPLLALIWQQSQECVT